MYKSNFSKRKLSPLALSILLFLPIVLMAQQPSPTPVEKSEEEKRLEEEKRITQLKKEIAENKKAELSASFPSPSSTPLSGEIKVSDGAVIESQMVAYFAMGKVADTVVAGIKGKVQKNNLAIFNTQDVNLLLGYKVTKNQVGIIKNGYCDLLPIPDPRLCPVVDAGNPDTAAFAASIVKSFLGGFIDVAALFRTNVEIKGTTFDIEEGSFAAEIFRAGRRPTANDGFEDIQLYYPALFAPQINPDADSQILTDLELLNRLRTFTETYLSSVEEKTKALEESTGKIKNLTASIKQSEEQITNLENGKVNLLKIYCSQIRRPTGATPPCSRMPAAAKEKFFDYDTQLTKLVAALTKANSDLLAEREKNGVLDKELKELWTLLDPDNPDPDKPRKLLLSGKISQLKAKNAQFDKLVESLVAPSASGPNALTSLIKAESYLNALPKGSFWLQIKVIKAGGNNRIKTNLILDIFRGGNRISHSGGVIAQYILFDGNGNVVLSDVVTEYVDYIKSGKIKDLK